MVLKKLVNKHPLFLKQRIYKLLSTLFIMNSDDKLRLKDNILFLKESAIVGSLNVSDNTLMELSVKLFISENIQNSKNNNKSITPKIEEVTPATQKQLDYLNKLKIKYPINVSKKEAFQILKGATS